MLPVDSGELIKVVHSLRALDVADDFTDDNRVAACAGLVVFVDNEYVSLFALREGSRIKRRRNLSVTPRHRDQHLGFASIIPTRTVSQHYPRTTKYQHRHCQYRLCRRCLTGTNPATRSPSNDRCEFRQSWCCLFGSLFGLYRNPLPDD